MDEHLIAPGPDFKWHVNQSLDPRVYRMLLELRGQKLFLPVEPKMYPKREALEWRLERLSSSR